MNLLKFKNTMGGLITIKVWYSPDHPKCRNCYYWVGFSSNGRGLCANKGWYRWHTHPSCKRFKLIIGEFKV